MTRGFFASLEAMISPAAVLAEWRETTQAEFTPARSFLRPTGQRAHTLPCPQRPRCGCRHEVAEAEGAGLQAVCRCELANCATVPVALIEVVVHELDVARLCAAVRGALGFGGPTPGPLPGATRSWRIGGCGPRERPVVLSITGDEGALLAEVGSVCAVVSEPCLVLTPAGMHFTPRVEAAVRRHQSLHLPLTRLLRLTGPGRFECAVPTVALLAEWERRLARDGRMEQTVARIDRNLEAVARGHYELRKENEELKQLQADGFLRFSVRVDAEDFRAFAAIMALGNRKVAAEALKVPLRSFYDRVDTWRARSRDYQRMHRMVEWRKAVGRKIKVPLNESLLSSESAGSAENPETRRAVLDQLAERETEGREDLLRDLLEALENQNATNWPAVRQELISILKDEVPQ